VNIKRPFAQAVSIALVAMILGGCGSDGETKAGPSASSDAQSQDEKPTTAKETSIAVSFGCRLRADPGIVLFDWLTWRSTTDELGEFAANSSKFAKELRQSGDCPAQVVELADAVEAAALGFKRGDISADEVEATVKAYWIALASEEQLGGYDPETAYEEAVKVLSGN
jgi:hypothetical protein